jgi:hypothetical protein
MLLPKLISSLDRRVHLFICFTVLNQNVLYLRVLDEVGDIVKLWNGVGGGNVRVNACVSLICVLVKPIVDFNIHCRN